MPFICYLLQPASGGTYIGVTGLPLRKRIAQHRRERFPGVEHVTILDTAPTRQEINVLEAALVAALKPTLNKRQGGTSVDSYRHGQGRKRSPRKLTANVKAWIGKGGNRQADPNFCRNGHWWDDYRVYRGAKFCRKCDAARDRARRLANRNG